MKIRVQIDLLDDSGQVLECIDSAMVVIPRDGLAPTLQQMLARTNEGTYDSVLQKSYRA